MYLIIDAFLIGIVILPTSYNVKNQYPATGACQKLASPYVSAF